jgi:biopolymer transport protein TolR
VRRPAAPPEPITRVNVTPIIDVALVLVIILLVTAPMLSAPARPVALPAAAMRDGDEPHAVTVTRATDGSLAVGETVVAPGGLRDALAMALAHRPDALVVLRADAGTPWREVRTLIDVLRAAGAKRIAVATRPQEQRS